MCRRRLGYPRAGSTIAFPTSKSGLTAAAKAIGGGIAKNTLSPGNALGQIKPRRRLRGLLLQSLRRQWLRLSRGAIRLQFFSIEVVEEDRRPRLGHVTARSRCRRRILNNRQ